MTVTDTPISGSHWYEVQGLVLCPMHGDNPRRRGNCSVPVEGEWHAIYFLDSRSEAEETLEHVMDSEARIYERYEDFRLAVPTEQALKRRRVAEGFAWERHPPRKVPAVASRNTISTGRKKKGKRKQAA